MQGRFLGFKTIERSNLSAFNLGVGGRKVFAKEAPAANSSMKCDRLNLSAQTITRMKDLVFVTRYALALTSSAFYQLVSI